MFPPPTLFFNAGHQDRIKVRIQVIVNYRIFLKAPVGFHDPGSALVVIERCQRWCENEIYSSVQFFNVFLKKIKNKISFFFTTFQ